MVDCYVGEVRLFAGSRVPDNWHACDGTQLSISGNEVLYSLIGTTYGGNGVTTFGLPDLRGRVPIGQGQGVGLTLRSVGAAGGTETVALVTSQMPAHSHVIMTAGASASTATPGPGMTLANTDLSIAQYLKNGAASSQQVQLSGDTVALVGSGQAHNNVMPSAVLTYIIALVGIYPTQS
ncbi:tail fiber protein [Pseudomonas sp. AL 58]|uniref:phage tail protein n=1 Tax=Pseudomonas sp. AL 58 TaxID=3104275 RepID=UPI002EB207C7|nr:tail fiber protein [Pseudomonas sp. AL 58]